MRKVAGRVTIRIGAAVLLAGGALQLGPALPALASSGAPSASRSPDHRRCLPSNIFSIGRNSYTDLGDPHRSAWAWLHNRSSGKAGLQLSFNTNSQVTYGIASTQGVDAGVIFAKVSASISESISYSHTDIESKTATVDIPGHWYGELGADNFYAVGHGIDTIVTPDCHSRKITVRWYGFPTRTPPGYEADTTSYAPVRPPWPLAP